MTLLPYEFIFTSFFGFSNDTRGFVDALGCVVDTLMDFIANLRMKVPKSLIKQRKNLEKQNCFRSRPENFLNWILRNFEFAMAAEILKWKVGEIHKLGEASFVLKKY